MTIQIKCVGRSIIIFKAIGDHGNELGRLRLQVWKLLHEKVYCIPMPKINH